MFCRTSWKALRVLPIAVLCFSVLSLAQAPASGADTLIFSNGEQLTGSLEKADSSGITFKSPMVGEITVKWDNIKELKSDKNFAVLDARTKLTRKDALAVVPQGPVTVADKQISVATSSGPKSIPTSDANLIVDATGFDKALNHPPGFLHGWVGAVGAGASLIRATQNSTTFTGNLALVRAIPTVSWLPPRNRTSISYNQAYGSNSQAVTVVIGGIPQNSTQTVKTNIFHADAERDEYFSPRIYAFGLVAFDHNFSQLLDLQQAYGGGIGATILRSALEQLDVRGDVHYEKQSFLPLPPSIIAAPSQNLIGSTFSETYLRHLPRTILLNEFASISPAWNNTNAYSAHATAALIFPVYKGFAFNIGAADDYLNNAPLGSKKNSVQFTSGITYLFR